MRRVLKLIFLTIIFVIIIWLEFFLIDYNHYINNRKPSIIISRTRYNYVDGYVNEYNSLGYKYIDYHRGKIKKKQLVPFWKNIED